MLRAVLFVGLGSFAGGALRYLVSLAVRPVGEGFPLPTFIVNLAGCFLIGLIYGLVPKQSDTALLLATGLCGGFTTFSSFCNESLLLIQNGRYITVAAYILLSTILGILFAFVGYAVAK